RPARQMCADFVTEIRWQWCGRLVQRLLDPGGDFTVGGVDDLVAGANRSLVDGDGSAQDMKAGAGTKFPSKSDIQPADSADCFVHAESFCDRRSSVAQPIEIIRDRKMLSDVALPGRYDAANGLGPGGHRTNSQNRLQTHSRGLTPLPTSISLFGDSR